jgi:site-specific recombinase XerD
MGGQAMKKNTAICNVATSIERYFTDRLMRQRNVSANTIAAYRDTFRLLFSFAQEPASLLRPCRSTIWTHPLSAHSWLISRRSAA